MTTRSARSTTSRISSKDTVTDGDVYVFLLQTALLSFISQPKPEPSAAASNPASSSSTPAAPSRKTSDATTSSSRSDWMSLSGLADMVSLSSSSKSVRFPEKLVKKLGERLSSIAMGRDPNFNEQSLRSTLGVFYGTYSAPAFQKQMKENRKVEELILIFVTTAQAALKKRPGNTGEEWKEELNLQVGQFIKILKETLKTMHGVPRELTERLESYSSKLTPKPISLSDSQTTSGSSNNTTSPPSTSTNASTATLANPDERRVSTASGSTAVNDQNGNEGYGSLGDPLDHPLIKTLGKLFNVEIGQLKKDVEFLKASCTEAVSIQLDWDRRGAKAERTIWEEGGRPKTKSNEQNALFWTRIDPFPLTDLLYQQAALADLKHCVKNINLQASWPGRKEDFSNPEAYQSWRAAELQELSSTMMKMCQVNPSLLKSTSFAGTGADATGSRRDSSTSQNSPPQDSLAKDNNGALSDEEALSSALEQEALDDAFDSFTYIPPSPKGYYKRALALCLDADLEAIKSQPEDEEVSLSILSKPHLDLLNECATKWRLNLNFRNVANLETIRGKYERGEVPLDCVVEALSKTQASIQAGEVESWMTRDRQDLVFTYTLLFDSFLRMIYDAFQDIQNVDAEEVMPYVDMVDELHSSSLVREDRLLGGRIVELDKHVEELKDSIRITAIHEYTAKTTDLFSQAIPNEVVPLVALIEWLEKGAQRLDRRYQEPLLGTIDPVSLVLEKQVPLYLDDLESMKSQIVDHATREKDPLAFEDIFALYKRVGSLLEMHKAFCPDSVSGLSFSISDWFEPHIRHWLSNTELKTTQWVENALSSDSFEPIDADGADHSSSIDDLFGALQQPVDFILSLKWPDAYRNARFLTSLAKTISRSIEQYCARVEELFMEEMFPRTAEGQDQNMKQSAWMVKAKQTLQGEKRVEPFHFQPASCVKLNNIEAARRLLDKIYIKIDADEQARIIKEQAPVVPDKRSRDRYIFTVKVVLGENLQPVKDSSGTARIDSFVTLSDERGAKIAKTRTIYETPDPRWDEVFDIPVEQSTWLAATVWDRKLVGDHNLCGRAYLRLDPKYFGDFLAHELWLDLDTQGRLLLRVSMEGEKDDILFYFGRAFRSLKRAESDMVRIIVDKMSIFIRQCLSRSILKSLVKTSGLNLDKAFGNVTGGVKALYASALASTNANASVIPPVEAEIQAARKANRPQQLSDQEIEAAIAPLFDYLDECLGTLKSSLSENESQLVLTKVWKEVLNTVDGILLPPLSDQPSDLPQLAGKEVDIVFKWLTFLRNYFAAIDEETGIAEGVPLEELQSSKYREILSFALWCDEPTDRLMEACVGEMQAKLRRAPTKKSKSVMNQRSLGTIKKRKEDKRKGVEDTNNLDLLMRLLRMRPGTSEFLTQQMATISSVQAAMAATSPPRARGAGTVPGGPSAALSNPHSQRNSRGAGGDVLPPLPGGQRGSLGGPRQQQQQQLYR